MTSQKLSPLQVPWYISTNSGETGDLICRENESATLTFAGRVRVAREDVPGKTFTLAKILPECDFENRWYIVGTTLTFTFRGPTWLKVHPLQLDQDAQALFKFDVSDIPNHLQPYTHQPIDEWMDLWNASQCEWLASGICPTPYVYEVIDSDWVEEINTLFTLMKIPSRKLHHYLFATYEMFYEVVADDFTWTSEPWMQDESEE